MKYCDAHNHLHDSRLAPYQSAWMAALQQLPISAAVVNGTCEKDWDAVDALASEHRWITPSFGIHPWYVATRTDQWLARLRECLEQRPGAGVGEIGLDRWVEGHDVKEQVDVFLPQLVLATELHRPATIHCLRAWGALMDLLRAHQAPARGFLLHSYGGPVEMVDEFAELGAYFSFSPYFLHPRKAAKRELFRHRIPLDRLLVETDAPDMRPPDEHNPRPLIDSAGAAINHPANLDVAYRGLAELRHMDVHTLAARVEDNFVRLFGQP